MKRSAAEVHREGQEGRPSQPGTLYFVPTPIGNLEDITLRALRVLHEARLVLAEDTRTTGNLLRHFSISVPLLSYTEHNHAARLQRILDELEQGNVALVSEAGMPGINDPGQALVQALVVEGVNVVGLPGPSAVPLAVAMAGFHVASFTFLGFLPRTSRERREVLQRNAGSGHALVAFETPHRLRAALEDIDSVLGERPLAVCRELTKLHEEVFRGTAQESLAHFESPRGEIVLVIAAGGGDTPETDDADIDVFLSRLAAEGTSARDAVAAAVARFGVGRRVAYERWQSLRRQV